MYQNERWRATGRTTRMLLAAIRAFLEGNNVLVTAWSERDAKDLCYRVMDVLYAFGVVAGVERKENEIIFNGKRMIFDAHYFDKGKYDGIQSLLVYSDHYWVK